MYKIENVRGLRLEWESRSERLVLSKGLGEALPMQLTFIYFVRVALK